ncbi:glycosyltransferase family 4 protein, partial [bacterium]|nr:glycosyltransferase family 4 protein [bacterium]
RFLVLGNSVDLKKNRIRRIVPGYDSEELKLGFVGNLSSWHGIDRLIHGLSDYIGTRKIKLYLVGKGSEFDKLKSELNLIPSKERVVFLGSLTGKDLADFYCSINIAVSSLALHRLEMTDGGPLKTPEYMAKGIPFIIGYNDLEIPPHFPFVFRVSSDDKPIDINKLFCFYDTLIGKKQTDMMRKFAKKNMCFSVKTAKLYNFFKNLV